MFNVFKAGTNPLEAGFLGAQSAAFTGKKKKIPTKQIAKV